MISVNPFYANRLKPHLVAIADDEPICKVVIGNATLYRADCFDVLPTLETVDAVVTDPPFGIGYSYRSHDDAPDGYEPMMRRLVPELVRVTGDGPCFVWQSPLKAEQWHRVFPTGFRIVAACKLNPERNGRSPCLSWDPVIFWSGRSLLRDELPRDWHLADLRPWDGYRGGKACGAENEVMTIEDMLPRDFYLDCVRKSHESKLRGLGIDPASWPTAASGPILLSVQRAAEASKLQFNKGSAAKLARRKLIELRNFDSLSEDSLRYARSLIASIRASFGKNEGTDASATES